MVASNDFLEKKTPQPEHMRERGKLGAGGCERADGLAGEPPAVRSLRAAVRRAGCELHAHGNLYGTST